VLLHPGLDPGGWFNPRKADEKIAGSLDSAADALTTRKGYG
jgi:hypothetical protein